MARGPGIETGRDDAKYLLLGRALRHLSYREFWRPDAPIHAEYPPGYPLFLAITGAFAGERYDWFIALNIAMSVGMLWLLWRTIERRWSWLPALLVLMVLAPNSYLVDRAGQLVSETLFTLLGVASVVLLAREEPGPRRMAAAGALAIAAAMTRSIGVALVAAVVLLWLSERRWRAAASFAAASLVTVGSWLAWTVHAAPRIRGESYVGDALLTPPGAHHGFLLTLAARATQQLADFIGVYYPLVVSAPSVPGTLVDNVIGSAVLAIAGLAGLLVFWKQWRAAALYVLLTLAVLMVWPFFLTRFAVPLAPLLAAGIVLGLQALVRPLRWRIVTMVAVSATLAATGLARSLHFVDRHGGCVRGSWPPAPSCTSPDRTSVFNAAMWLRAHLPPDAVVVYAKPETIAYYSGRKAYPVLELLGQGSSLVDRVRSIGAQWILLSAVAAPEPRVLRERLQSDCARLALVASFPPHTYLFKVAEQPPPDSAACQALEVYRRATYGRDFEQ